MLERLQSSVNENPNLIRRGRFVSTTFMVEIGDTQWMVRIEGGKVSSVAKGPFVMPSWTFALRASEDTWKVFWRDVPPPGFHDLMALIKKRLLSVDGDIYPFMSNLRYFKEALATIRSGGRA